MKQEINRIDIVPAMFVGYREDNNILLKCLQGEETVNRAFEPNLFENINDPKYLLLGIITGTGYMQLNICEASEYEDLFHKHWKVLLK